MNQLELLSTADANLTKEEVEQVQLLLSNPTVQKYFKLIHFNAMRDVTDNEIDTTEKEGIFLARYKRFLGVQQICALVASFAKRG